MLSRQIRTTDHATPAYTHEQCLDNKTMHIRQDKQRKRHCCSASCPFWFKLQSKNHGPLKLLVLLGWAEIARSHTERELNHAMPGLDETGNITACQVLWMRCCRWNCTPECDCSTECHSLPCFHSSSPLSFCIFTCISSIILVPPFFYSTSLYLFISLNFLLWNALCLSAAITCPLFLLCYGICRTVQMHLNLSWQLFFVTLILSIFLVTKGWLLVLFFPKSF